MILLQYVSVNPPSFTTTSELRRGKPPWILTEHEFIYFVDDSPEEDYLNNKICQHMLRWEFFTVHFADEYRYPSEENTAS